MSLRRAEERGLVCEQSLYRGTCDGERRRLPDQERPEGIAPRCPRPAAQQRDRAQEAEHHEQRDRGKQEAGELAEHEPTAEHDVAGADQQAEEEQQP